MKESITKPLGQIIGAESYFGHSATGPTPSSFFFVISRFYMRIESLTKIYYMPKQTLGLFKGKTIFCFDYFSTGGKIGR